MQIFNKLIVYILFLLFLLIINVACFSESEEKKAKKCEDLINKGNIISATFPKKAIAFYDQAFVINPKSTEALICKGSIWQRQNNYDEALKCYDKAIEIDNSAKAWEAKAWVLEKMKKLDEAIKCYEALTALDPKNEEETFYVTSAWEKKGDLLVTERKYTEAITSYNKAIEVNPKFAKQVQEKIDALPTKY